MIEIRRLGSEDSAVAHAAVERFRSVSGPEGGYLDDLRHVVIVATVDDTAATVDDNVVGWVHGYVLDRIDGRRMSLLYEVDVAPDHQRRGIGRRLVEEFLSQAKAEGCQTTWVLTDTSNDGAIALYRSTGAEQAGPQAMFRWSMGG